MDYRMIMLARFEQLKEARAGSDRVCGIVLGAAVQDALKGAMVCVLVKRNEHSRKLLSPDGPLGNWGVTNDLAHSIGLISDDVWHDLDCVRRIRNKFAHWGTVQDSSQIPRTLTFLTDDNRDLALNLKCPEIHPPLDFGGKRIEDFVMPEGGTDAIPRLPPPTDPRQRFELTCDCLMHIFGRVNNYYANPAVSTRMTFDYPTLNKPGDVYKSSDSSSIAAT